MAGIRINKRRRSSVIKRLFFINPDCPSCHSFTPWPNFPSCRSSQPAIQICEEDCDLSPDKFLKMPRPMSIGLL